MAGWYYAHEDNKLGPFSGDQLKELAASGKLLPTDTVWRDGSATGVSASLVKNLFATLPSPPAVAVADTPKPVAREKTPPPPERPKRGTATALKGAVIAGQDGTEARYRMKCKICSHMDASCRTIKITNKTTKSAYFCPKCRKRCEVVIQCRLG